MKQHQLENKSEYKFLEYKFEDQSKNQLWSQLRSQLFKQLKDQK